MAYKRTSSTSKSGVRRTNTYNRKTGGTTRSMSIGTKHTRVTYSTGPNGKSSVTRTYKSGDGFITRTTKSLTPKTPKVKKIKTKVYKPPKPPKIKAPKVTRPKQYRPKKTRVSRSRSYTRSYGSYSGSSDTSTFWWWVVGFIILFVIFS